MDERNYAKLNARQRGDCDRIRAEAVRDGTPVATLLLCADLSRRDRAAIADAFSDGAGVEYLS